MIYRFLLFAFALTLASCEKKESVLVLPPPPAGADHDQVSIGADYSKVVYYDFETGSAVFSSDLNAWDLAFQAAPDGRFVFMNGGKNVYVYNTHRTDMAAVNGLPIDLYNATDNGKGWGYDDPNGLPDSSFIRQWWGTDGKTKGEVYIVHTADKVQWKMRILAADATHYSVEWAPLSSSAQPVVTELTKDPAYNFVYFSFTNGIVTPEPPKDSYDVLFTQYRHIYRKYDSDGSDFLYLVRGALLNPYNTSGAADSVDDFGAIDPAKAESLPLVTARDVIGFDWKSINFNAGGDYVVNQHKNYIVRTRKGELYKLHFLYWYDGSHVGGNPSFEFMRMR